MSWVTNVIITASLCNQEECDDGIVLVPAIDAINAELVKLRKGVLDRVEPTRSGKALETTVHIGAFNYLSTNEILGLVRAAPWEDPDTVQVFIQEEEEDLFTVHRIDGQEEAHQG